MSKGVYMPESKVFNPHFGVVKVSCHQLADVFNFETVTAEQMAVKWLECFSSCEKEKKKVAPLILGMVQGGLTTPVTKAKFAEWLANHRLWLQDHLSLPAELINWIVMYTVEKKVLQSLLQRLSDFTKIDRRAAGGRTELGFERLSKKALAKLLGHCQGLMDSDGQLAAPGLQYLIQHGAKLGLNAKQIEAFEQLAEVQASLSSMFR
jgi:hypothetical protein